MTASAATPGYGTVLKRDNSPVAEVQNITGPGVTLGTAEVTHLSSPAAWREYIATLLDGGEVSFDLNFLPATHELDLLADMIGRILQDFTIEFTDVAVTTWGFKAYVVKFTPTAPVEGKLAASCTLKVSGPVDFSVA